METSTSRRFEIDCAKWPAKPGEEGVETWSSPVCVDMEVRQSKNEGTLEIKARALTEYAWETLGSASYKKGKKQLKLDGPFPASYGQSPISPQKLAEELSSGIVKDYATSPISTHYSMRIEDFKGNLRESLKSGLEELMEG